MAKPSGKDLLGIGLILIGGVIVPIIGWIAGVILVLRSRTWATRDKLVAFALVPGGLFLPVLISEMSWGASGSCTGHGGPGVAATTVCSGGAGAGHGTLGLIIVAVLAAAALVGPGWLLRQARRPHAAS